MFNFRLIFNLLKEIFRKIIFFLTFRICFFLLVLKFNFTIFIKLIFTYLTWRIWLTLKFLFNLLTLTLWWGFIFKLLFDLSFDWGMHNILMLFFDILQLRNLKFFYFLSYLTDSYIIWWWIKYLNTLIKVYNFSFYLVVFINKKLDFLFNNFL